MTICKSVPIEMIGKERALVVRALAEELRRGSLALGLGAGISSGMGLPSWWELVRDCVVGVGIAGIDITSRSTNDELLRAMNRVESGFNKDTAKYHNLVRDHLYAKCKTDSAILEHKLMAVIGAMTMRSRRGCVTEVLTLNFDDIVERYLDLHGFISQSITQLPEVRFDVDVTVYHIHGFLASHGSCRSDSEKRIVFSGVSFDQFAGAEVEAFRSLLRDLLLRKVMLFVGMSPGQPTINQILMGIKNDITETRGVTGFWFLGPDDPDHGESELLERNVVPIRLANYDEYVTLLLDVCRQAASPLK